MVYIGFICCALFPNDWYDLVCQWCMFWLVFGCVTVQKSATLAQASQARLGEISRESSLFLLERLT